MTEKKKEKRYFVYLLRCADDTLYCGYTTDLAHRLQMHNSGRGAKYTAGRGPVTLSFFEEHTDLSAALRREAAIKKMSRQEKLALIGQLERNEELE